MDQVFQKERLVIFYMLDIKNKKEIKYYIFLSILCTCINLIYSKFSHGVSSNYMTYLFIIPLIGGSIFLFINKKNIKYNLYHLGIITLIIGSLIKGILEIAGTSSVFNIVYFIFGISLIIISIVKYIINFKK